MKKSIPKKSVADLLKESAADLKKMTKTEVHDAYKKITAVMLHDFYLEASNHAPPLNTFQDLHDFIDLFITKHILPPNPEWTPGDQGK